jgi:hypothetical protein
MQWVFAFTVAKVTPLMIANLGDKGYGTFLVYGSCCFCAATFVFLCCPETKGKFGDAPLIISIVFCLHICDRTISRVHGRAL